MADWEEIKRLAADFQRAQLSSTVQRLSERNCIEIVQRLVENKLVDILYTIDGKEYLTPQELVKEIREELQVCGGRVNLADLQQALNVDYSHIETKVNDIVKSDRSLTLILGQLIDIQYFDTISEEINDLLQEQGQVSIADLALQYALPGEFLSEGIRERLGSAIQGRVDDSDTDTIFTQAFVDKYTARIRGTFSAVTRPVYIAPILQKYGIQERMFYSILEDLIGSQRLCGNISGARKDKAQYVPDIYTRSQNQWVDSFYQQNGYLEYDSLSRLGISDPKSYIKKRLKSAAGVMYLSSCCVGLLIQEQLEAQIDEAMATVGWIDVMPHVPSVLSSSDISQILTQVLKSKSGMSIMCEAIIASDSFVNTCSKPFDKLMAAKAEKDARTNPALLVAEGDKKSGGKLAGMDDGGQGKEDKKEQRRKKATSGKSGGGTQGREVKMKSTKKKNFKGRDDDGSEDETPAPQGRSLELEFMTTEEIMEELQRHSCMKECPEELVEAVAERIYRPLKRQYQSVAKSIFLQHMGSTSSTSRKKTHDDLADKVNGLWSNAKLFEKGLKLFNEETQAHLCRHLLRTACTDITNLVFNAIAADHMMSVQDEATITPEIRQKILAKMPDDKAKNTLVKLHAALTGKSLDEFFTQLDHICAQLEVLLKKADKKKERQIVFSHRQALAGQLRDEEDAAMVLHLASTLLFHIFTQSLVHAPGRCVPQIITFLQPYLQAEQHQVLLQCQEAVVADVKLQSSDGGEGDASQIETQLKELKPKVKEIALNAKKPNASAANNED